ncbi:MAG: hypothetical protein KW793_01565 [Candidatus Doudnabacteria bacterium]|nr:hypothetical protein [Candidatus Doudnabacteria bacterium]
MDGIQIVDQADEYFHDLLHGAIERQQIKTSEETEVYLVWLLTSYVRLTSESKLPGGVVISVKQQEALNARKELRVRGLREIADMSLFVAGFFSSSRAIGMDMAFLRKLGSSCYGRISRDHQGLIVYQELATDFNSFCEVLDDVRNRTSLANDQDTLRIYKEWLRTHRPELERKLRVRGILANN